METSRTSCKATCGPALHRESFTGIAKQDGGRFRRRSKQSVTPGSSSKSKGPSRPSRRHKDDRCGTRLVIPRGNQRGSTCRRLRSLPFSPGLEKQVKQRHELDKALIAGAAPRGGRGFWDGRMILEDLSTRHAPLRAPSERAVPSEGIGRLSGRTSPNWDRPVATAERFHMRRSR